MVGDEEFDQIDKLLRGTILADWPNRIFAKTGLCQPQGKAQSWDIVKKKA